MSTEFKAIDGDERARWDQLAAEDKERYNREMEDYTPPSDDDDSDSDSDESDAPKKKKKRKKKDPNAPKRAKSAFMFFSMAMRPQIKEENPDATFGGLVSMMLHLIQNMYGCLCYCSLTLNYYNHIHTITGEIDW